MAEVEVFAWSPRIGLVGEVAQATLKAQFGDGYAQVAQAGINPEKQTWPVSFKGSAAYVLPIINFLRRHGAVLPFQWSPPLLGAGMYLAEGFSLQPHGGDLYTVSTTFRQFYGG